MDKSVIAALIAAVASLVVAAGSAWFARGAQVRESKAQKDIEEFKREATKEVELLKSELQERVDREKREREGEAVLARYREPLTAAAFDLQSRLYNIIDQDFLVDYASPGNERAEEAIKSTLFKFAQFFGWREIVRHEIHFLRFPEDTDTRAVGELLTEVEEAFNTDSYAPEFMLWKDEQRALGELMIVRQVSPKTCLPYWDFFELYDTNPYISRWFARLERHLRDGKASKDRRLAFVQSILRTLVMKLDPDGLQYTHSAMKVAGVFPEMRARRGWAWAVTPREAPRRGRAPFHPGP